MMRKSARRACLRPALANRPEHPWSDLSNQGCSRNSRPRSQKVDDLVGEALLAKDDVELAAGGDLLQDFQLTQPHEGRAVRQQLGRVGLAANRRRLLSPRDQVGLGCLPGFRHLVHQVLHLARQNHVTNADRGDRQTEFARPTPEGLLDLPRNGVLVGQEDVELRAPTAARSTSCVSRYSACRTSSVWLIALRASTIL